MGYVSRIVTELSQLMSTQKRQEASAFITSTTGEAQGNWAGSITPVPCNVFNWEAFSFLASDPALQGVVKMV